jgi:hypothetical protein
MSSARAAVKKHRAKKREPLPAAASAASTVEDAASGSSLYSSAMEMDVADTPMPESVTIPLRTGAGGGSKLKGAVGRSRTKLPSQKQYNIAGVRDEDDPFTFVPYSFVREARQVQHDLREERTVNGSKLLAEMLQSELVQKHDVIVSVKELATRLQGLTDRERHSIYARKEHELREVDFLYDKVAKRYGYGFGLQGTGAGLVRRTRLLLESFLSMRKRAAVDSLPPEARAEMDKCEEQLREKQQQQQQRDGSDDEEGAGVGKKADPAANDGAGQPRKANFLLKPRPVLPSLRARGAQGLTTNTTPNLEFPDDLEELLRVGLQLGEQIQQDVAFLQESRVQREEDRRVRAALREAKKAAKQAAAKLAKANPPATVTESTIEIRLPLIAMFSKGDMLMVQVFELEVKSLPAPQ